jgi:hypothetical protein
MIQSQKYAYILVQCELFCKPMVEHWAHKYLEGERLVVTGVHWKSVWARWWWDLVSWLQFKA